MTIFYDEQQKSFHLQNEHISYVFCIEEDHYVAHSYWGKKINRYVQIGDYPRIDRSFSPNPHPMTDRLFSLDTLLQEFPGGGTGDFRESAFELEYEDGTTVTQFKYKNYHIRSGKPVLNGLPATYVKEDNEADTLEITLEDAHSKMEVKLSYTIFSDRPIITRSVKFLNNGQQLVKINKALSSNVDFDDSNYELIQLPGSWGRERHLKRDPLTRGVHVLDSKRGTGSHVYQPFSALVRPETTEHTGEVFGFHFIYSGEFTARIEVDPFDQTRVLMGINPEHFSWNLNPGEEFQTPEVVLVYSETGLNGMSQSLHKLYRERLTRGVHQLEERPVLVNNWEATYFDFNEEKILNLADEAKELGIELVVLDDGWFGKRNDDFTSLGDWFLNEEKLPKGLGQLADEVKAKGLKFGIWFEPEMISEDSELYRAHPDWCVHVQGRTKSLGRSQYVLDYSRKEVRENIVEQLTKVMDELPLDYVKWDYNRNMTEIGSAALNVNQKETAHRFMLGLYEVLETLTTRYPKILFESCSGGGGRYDPGMLYYMPQTWTSDNTDAISRLKIQYGTSLLFPISSMGAHVSDIPNHQVNRNTSMKLRGDVAMSGNLGYELDLTTLSDSEKAEVKEQIQFYKEHRRLIQYGDFYRLLSPFDSNEETSWMFVSEDKQEALFFYYQILSEAHAPSKRVKLVGLDPNKVYQVEGFDQPIGGDELMNSGLYLNPELVGDFESRRLLLKAVR
ncbi:MAG: alpha-galactosidase [Carnobacterium sp.]|uniref:alpha-galactosidase n=3 Tax=Carnobacterium sp. TaxID=48221 RepID=UPI002FCAEA4B